MLKVVAKPTTSVFASTAVAILLSACGGGGTSANYSEQLASAQQQPAVASDAQTTKTVAEMTFVPEAAPEAAPADTSAAPAPYGQAAADFTLTFSDEFDSFNSNVWNDHLWYETPSDTKNFTVEDGKLKIWPQRDAAGNFFNRSLATDGKYYQTYGYFEMEAKLPYGKGTWPAFWLFTHEAGAHPYRPEIDILEAYAGGGPNSGWSDASMRPTAYASTVWPNGIEGGPAAGTKTYANLGDLSADFHKYGVKWEPNKITFYFDGKEMYSVNESMDKRMYMILDLWYGSASGSPDDSTPQGKGNAYEVNYVRAWQFKQ
jgi:beta-glucanase (GH16 family)